MLSQIQGGFLAPCSTAPSLEPTPLPCQLGTLALTSALNEGRRQVLTLTRNRSHYVSATTGQHVCCLCLRRQRATSDSCVGSAVGLPASVHAHFDPLCSSWERGCLWGPSQDDGPSPFPFLCNYFVGKRCRSSDRNICIYRTAKSENHGPRICFLICSRDF